MEDQRLRRLAEAKSYLQRRIEELEGELELLKLLVNIVDAALSQESFVRASELPREAPAGYEAPTRPEPSGMGSLISESSIVSREGREMAKFSVYERGIVIKPVIELPLDSPPLRSFFVAKILDGYKKKDEELVRAGELDSEEAFDYGIEEEGGLVKEIRIRNYRDKRRLDEIRSALRWTLNRVLERMTGSSGA
ncbi:MAG: hypothetical protein QXF46_02515 [Thermofilaceae archaeon]